MPPSRSARIASQTSRRAAGSRPWVSSSSTTSCGRLSNASTRNSRCRWPPDSAAKAVRRCPARPKAASSPSTGAERGPRNSSTASATRSRSGSAESCCWLPTSDRSRGPSLAGSRPSTRSEPPSARRSPCRHSTVVVLPAPFAPSRPTISPSSTSRSTPSTTVRLAVPLAQPADLHHCGAHRRPLRSGGSSRHGTTLAARPGVHIGAWAGRRPPPAGERGPGQGEEMPCRYA